MTDNVGVCVCGAWDTSLFHLDLKKDREGMIVTVWAAILPTLSDSLVLKKHKGKQSGEIRKERLCLYDIIILCADIIQPGFSGM